MDVPGSNLTLFIFFMIQIRIYLVHFEKISFKVDVPSSNLTLYIFFSWWSNGRNGWWTSDGNWEESSWKLIFKATQNLFEKTSFLKSNKNWYFPTNYLKKFKTIFNHFFILECGREVAVEWNCKKMSVFHDEIEIEDMDFDEENQIYHYPCPCGDRFEIR